MINNKRVINALDKYYKNPKQKNGDDSIEDDLIYHYFVSYSHNRGFGNIFLLLKKPIDTSDVVNEIKAYIERNSHVSDVVILNWQRLKN